MVQIIHRPNFEREEDSNNLCKDANCEIMPKQLYRFDLHFKMEKSVLNRGLQLAYSLLRIISIHYECCGAVCLCLLKLATVFKSSKKLFSILLCVMNLLIVNFRKCDS